MKIATRLTRLLNISTPIVVAPMGYAVTPRLAAAVTASGGFGTMGAAFMSSEAIDGLLKETRTILKVPEGKPIPVAMGLLGWILDKTEVSDDPRIPRVLAQLPQAVWLAFGDDLGKYVKQIRDYDAKREHKTVIIVNVVSVAEAVRAANEWKVDALVIQGIESGGHGGADSPPLTIFLQAVIKALPNAPPLLAAGGVATGAQIASLLTLGADGVVLGTRFLTTNECGYTPTVKSVLQSAPLNSTVRTLAYDEVGRTNMWPKGIDGRAVVNKIMTDYEAGLTLEERLQRFDDAKKAGETDRLIVWAGAAVGLTDDLRSASDLVEELHRDTVTALQSVSSLLS